MPIQEVNVKRNHLKLGRVCALILTNSACFRGRPSEKPPIHINPNMDITERYNVQAEGPFFANGAAMRIPVAGTVARGTLAEDDIMHTGVSASGDTVTTNPMPISMALLARGKERYNIYCTPCHGALGDGKSPVVSLGLLPPPDFHSPLLRSYPDGHFFNVITNGIRNMPGYSAQIPVEDRWAIVAYVRALQRSQNATTDD